MKLMLDTNICIYIIKRRPPAVLERFKQYEIGDIAISAITLSELRYGVAKSREREGNAVALDQFVTPLEILPYDEVAAQAYGTIRATLEQAGTPIGAMNLLIASHAVSQRLPLVTNNTREFSRVQGLVLQNWME